MNYFFALELSEIACRQAAEIAETWASRLTPEQKAKWTALEDYHLTLHFLGDLPEEALADLIGAAAPVAAATKPFELQLTQAGTFPHPRSPRVLWLGVRPCQPLLDLVMQLREAFEVLGYPPEKRPFRPHITLARCRPGRGEESWPTPSEQVFSKWTVARFALMQTLSPESSANSVKGRYNSVHTFPFEGKFSHKTSNHTFAEASYKPKQQGETIG